MLNTSHCNSFGVACSITQKRCQKMDMTRFVKTDWTQPSAELYVADRVTCGFPSYVSQVLPLSPETTLIVLIFFFHSSYDDPKILDEISLDDFLFLT